MLNNEQFAERLQSLMRYYNCNASSFSERIGIGRSTISHIISGRNKPSLDFVLNISESFPEVTFEWLVYGRGNFPAKSSVVEKVTSSNAPVPKRNSKLKKAPNTIPEVKEDEEDLFLSLPPFDFEAHEKKSTEPTNKKQIDRIVIFYSDGTFSEYKKS